MPGDFNAKGKIGTSPVPFISPMHMVDAYCFDSSNSIHSPLLGGIPAPPWWMCCHGDWKQALGTHWKQHGIGATAFGQRVAPNLLDHLEPFPENFGMDVRENLFLFISGAVDGHSLAYERNYRINPHIEWSRDESWGELSPIVSEDTVHPELVDCCPILPLSNLIWWSLQTHNQECW